MATSDREQPASRSATANGAIGSAVRASRAAPTAARALRVVELVASDPVREWRLTDIQRQLGYSHGNLHAIVATLVAMGYLRREPGSRTYALGPALLGLGAAARHAYPAVDVAEPHLELLAERLGTQTHAAMRVGEEILVVARCGPELPLGGGVEVGTRVPLTPPMGSTLMAWASPAELDAYFATAEGALTPDELAASRASLEAVRRRGHSVHVYAGPRQLLSEAAARVVAEGVDDPDHDLTELAHELARHDYLPEEPDASSVGEGIQLSAPVFDADSRVVLSVGVAFVGPRVDMAAVADAPEALLAAAATITGALGGRPPGSDVG